jgi:hypothetical protein
MKRYIDGARENHSKLFIEKIEDWKGVRQHGPCWSKLEEKKPKQGIES